MTTIEKTITTIALETYTPFTGALMVATLDQNRPNGMDMYRVYVDSQLVGTAYIWEGSERTPRFAQSWLIENDAPLHVQRLLASVWGLEEVLDFE